MNFFREGEIKRGGETSGWLLLTRDSTQDGTATEAHTLMGNGTVSNQLSHASQGTHYPLDTHKRTSQPRDHVTQLTCLCRGQGEGNLRTCLLCFPSTLLEDVPEASDVSPTGHTRATEVGLRNEET